MTNIACMGENTTSSIRVGHLIQHITAVSTTGNLGASNMWYLCGQTVHNNLFDISH